jgi:hypothetical protein
MAERTQNFTFETLKFWLNIVHIFEDGNDYLTKIPQTFCFTRYLKASAALENSSISRTLF